MASGLDKLASNLDDEQCKHLKEFYKEDEVFRLMRRKGVYPHKYMDGWRKFEETSLPPKDLFYSRLNKTMNMQSKFGIPWRKRRWTAIMIPT